jgi:hypothetical protein
MKKKKLPLTVPPAAPSPAHADIAALAHSYWEAEGCPEGAEWRHWLQAEAALSGGAKSDPKGNE